MDLNKKLKINYKLQYFSIDQFKAIPNKTAPQYFNCDRCVTFLYKSTDATDAKSQKKTKQDAYDYFDCRKKINTLEKVNTAEMRNVQKQSEDWP